MANPLGSLFRIARSWFFPNPNSVLVKTVGDLADATEIDMRGFAGGCLEVPTDSSLTTVTFYSCLTKGGTHRPAKDSGHESIQITVAAEEVVCFPDSVFNLPFIKLVGDAAEDVKIFLKG
jgi:hypothetical protein